MSDETNKPVLLGKGAKAAPQTSVDLDLEVAAKAPEPEPEERLHPLLSNEEFKAAQEKARAKIEGERRKAAIRAVEEQETERLRMEEGLYTGGPGDEMVTITIDLPEFGAYLGVNFMRYWHGHTYTVPRHVANSLAEMMGRAWRHQDEIDGKSLIQHYQRARATVVSATKGVSNSPNRQI